MFSAISVRGYGAWFVFVGLASVGADRAHAAENLTAESIVEATGIQQGLALLLADDARLACDLAEDGKLLVHLLVHRPEQVVEQRAVAQARGLGGRIVVQALSTSGDLPHPDRFVNLVVADLEMPQKSGIKPAEFERVLAVRGMKYLKRNGQWRAEPPLPRPELDHWTHRFYDASGNCVSQDSLAAAPKAVQWQHGPALEDGTADGKVPRIAGGRLVTFDGQTGDLVCRDASNGFLLWRRFIGSPQNADLAVVSGEIYLYQDDQLRPGDLPKGLAERGPLVALDLSSGKLLRKYTAAIPAGTALPVETAHHEDAQRIEKYYPVPWFIVRDDVIVQAYGPELRVLERISGKLRFQKTLAAGDTWFSPVLLGTTLLAAETVGAGRRGRHDGATHVRAVAAFDLADGAPRWRNETAHPLRMVNDPKTGSSFLRAEFKPLSVAAGLALIHVSSYQFRHGGRVAVLDLATGQELWHRDFQPKELYDQGSQRAILRGGEVLILDGLGARRYAGRTGEPLGEPITLPKGYKRQARLNGACTASRATQDWLICNAYLYVGPEGKIAQCFGARGACGQGVVPANGLMYVNPTPCDCGDYTRGYEALAARLPGKALEPEQRLVRGPAYPTGPAEKLAMPSSGWPMFLGNSERTSATAEALPDKLTIRWQREVVRPRRDSLDADRKLSERYLGALSAPVCAAGCVLVSAPESHQLLALDAISGKLRWSIPTAGKVDSPPTLVLDSQHTAGLAICGCDDGSVSAVRLGDGALAWRMMAAPTDGLAMLHGHLASAMPLPGSPLVIEGTVLVAAGQHTDLGGLHWLALDAATGAIRAQRVIAADQPAVVTNDILVAGRDGSIWLGNGQSMLHLSQTLEDLPIEATKTGAAANRPALAFDRQGSRIRFRTDIGRGGSTHGWKGAMRTLFAAGHRIAFAADLAYVLRDPTAGDLHPVRADQVPAVSAVLNGPEKKALWSTSLGALGSRPSYSSLLKAGNRLYVGGGNRDGAAGFVQVLDAASGRLLETHELPSRVTECGLAAAEGQLLASCEEGQLVCLGSAD